MKSLYLILIFIGYSFTSQAQEDFHPELGRIDRESLEMNAYSLDSTADAIYLYNYGNVNFRYQERLGIVMVMDCWVRIKIFKESGLDKGSVAIPYYDGTGYENDEQITELKAFTYNLEDGQITTTVLDKKSLTKEKLSVDYYVSKFNLPNVKKGSVIEYSYKRVTPLTHQIEPSTWTFQGLIPNKWSEYNITIPYFLDYKINMLGYLPYYINKQNTLNVTVGHDQYNGTGMSYRLVVKDAPAFVNEPFMTTPSDYLSKIDFELATIAVTGEVVKHYSHSWKSIDYNLGEVSWFGGELNKTDHLKGIIQSISNKTKEPAERMNLAYSHIQNHMKWNRMNGISSKEGARKAYENKKGNVSDINLTLINLLRGLDLECDPVILSTRSHGRLNTSNATIESFDYLIAYAKIGNLGYQLDATQTYAKPGILPEQVINGTGRLIPEGMAGRFLEIKPTEIHSKLEMINASIIPNERLIKGTYSVGFGGYEALSWREQYAKENETVYQEDLSKEFPEWTIGDIKISNKAEKLEDPVKISCHFEVDNENTASEILYFNPILAGKWMENPLKSSSRIYPMDLTSGISSSYIGNFRIPEDYFIEEMPKSEAIVLPEQAGKFSYQVRQDGNLIQVNTSVVINKLRFMPDEYIDLKEFFERVVQKHAQPMIIKKKAN